MNKWNNENKQKYHFYSRVITPKTKINSNITPVRYALEREVSYKFHSNRASSNKFITLKIASNMLVYFYFQQVSVSE